MPQILQIRKIISAPTIKNEVIRICQEKGITATEYAYELIRKDVGERIEDRNKKNLPTYNPLLEEIKKVLHKHTPNL